MYKREREREREGKPNEQTQRDYIERQLQKRISYNIIGYYKDDVSIYLYYIIMYALREYTRI